MKYDVRVQNFNAPDIVIKGVDESDIGEVVTSWCGKNTTIIITQHEEGGAE